MRGVPAEPVDRQARALNLLGLARRAGRAVVGTKAVREAAKRRSLALSLVAADAGDNARQRVVPVFESTGTRWMECGSAAELGRAVGRDRAVVVGIADARLGERIAEVLDPMAAQSGASGEVQASSRREQEGRGRTRSARHGELEEDGRW